MWPSATLIPQDCFWSCCIIHLDWSCLILSNVPVHTHTHTEVPQVSKRPKKYLQFAMKDVPDIQGIQRSTYSTPCQSWWWWWFWWWSWWSWSSPPDTHTFTLAHAIMYTVYSTHLHKHKHLYSVYTQIHKLVQTNTLAPEEMHLPTINAHQHTFSQTHTKEQSAFSLPWF